MTPAVLSIAPDTGTRLEWSTRDYGGSGRWVGTAQPQGGARGRPGLQDSLAVGQRPDQTALVPAEMPEAGMQHSGYRSTWSSGGDGNGMTDISPVQVPAPASVRPAADDAERPLMSLTRPVSTHGEGEPTVLWQRGFLSSSLAALKRVALERVTDQTIWMDAAQRLRTAAVVGRSRAPRHAALALVFGDALTFTVSEDLSDRAWGCLVQGLITLQEPFISTERERSLIRALLDSGWSLTGPFDVDTFSRLAPELFA